MKKIYDTNWNHCPGIYCIINITNNKRYIGSAIDLFKRIRRHYRELKYNYHYNTHLQNAYVKYGKENFEIEILKTFEKNISLNELHNIENDYIIKYNTCNSDYGYNKRDNNSFPILSHKSIIKQQLLNNNRKIKIMAFDQTTGIFYKEFESISKAAHELNDQSSNISKCCNSLTKSCKGYVFIKSRNYDPKKCYKKIIIKRKWTQEEKNKSLDTHSKINGVYLYNKSGEIIKFFRSLNEVDLFFKFSKSTTSHLFILYGNYIIYNDYLLSKKDKIIKNFNDIFQNAHKFIKK